MRRLPPFGPLLAFATVARMGSFTRAAEELALTQSAVSHRVRDLEDRLGVRLVERLNPGLRLTAAGRALLPDLERAIELLAGLADRLPDRREVQPLRLGLSTTLASRWLSPRLPAFAQRHPDLPVEIVGYDTPRDADAAVVDVSVRWVPAAAARSTPTTAVFPQETVFPVASPALLPAPLSDLPLIVKQAEGSGPEWSWRTWLGPDVAPERLRPALRFRELGPALAAAEAGHGAALARSLLVRDALAGGRLARVFPADRDLPCGKVLVATWRAGLTGDARVAALVEWMLTAAERSPSDQANASTG